MTTPEFEKAVALVARLEVDLERLTAEHDAAEKKAKPLRDNAVSLSLRVYDVRRELHDAKRAVVAALDLASTEPDRGSEIA